MADHAPDAGNRVRVSLECAFRGENLAYATVIDLDTCLSETAEAPDFHAAIARANGIDPYSYLYEVVESEEIHFSAATGLAASCCADGRFDWQSFVQIASAATEEALAMPALQAIAAQEMGISDLVAHPELKAALLSAYRAGRQSR